MRTYAGYNNNNRTSRRFPPCDHEWKYALTIGKKKIYQCSECGKIREEPENATLRLPKRKKRKL